MGTSPDAHDPSGPSGHLPTHSGGEEELFLRPADGSHLAAAAAAAERAVTAIGFETRHARSDQASRILSSTSPVFGSIRRTSLSSPSPGAVPQLAVDPGDPGDDAVGFDGAQNLSRLGIDLMDLAAAMLADPERAFGPRKGRNRRRCRRGSWRAHRRSSDRSSGCDLPRSGTNAGRQRPFPHARRHRSSAARCRSPDRGRSACHPRRTRRSGRRT